MELQKDVILTNVDNVKKENLFTKWHFSYKILM